MNRTTSFTAILTLTAVVGAGFWLSRATAKVALPVVAAPSAAPAAPKETLSARIERGKHLVWTAACNDCHTPWKMGKNGPAPDSSRLLSGHPQDADLPPAPVLTPPWVMAASATNTAWSGPWGTSFTANLTPDKDTGLGTWSEATFIATIRSGRHLGRGRPILPPMPIPVYQNFTDEELGSIFAYLQSIPAISNRVPDPLPPVAAPKRG